MTEMDSCVKADDVPRPSSLQDSDSKDKLFEKIVYFTSGFIGDEVNLQYAYYIHLIVLIYKFVFYQFLYFNYALDIIST